MVAIRNGREIRPHQPVEEVRAGYAASRASTVERNRPLTLITDGIHQKGDEGDMIGRWAWVMKM